MATFYEQSASTALSLISKFGAEAVISRVENAFDPVQGETVKLASKSGAIKALILPTGSTAKQAFSGADNTVQEGLISGKFRYMLAAAKGAPFEPEANDLVQLAGQLYTVKGCNALAPAGLALVYKIAVELSPGAAL